MAPIEGTLGTTGVSVLPLLSLLPEEVREWVWLWGMCAAEVVVVEEG